MNAYVVTAKLVTKLGAADLAMVAADRSVTASLDAVSLGARGLPALDLRQEVGEIFLKASAACLLWARWRGLAESLRKPIARNCRLKVCHPDAVLLP